MFDHYGRLPADLRTIAERSGNTPFRTWDRESSIPHMITFSTDRLAQPGDPDEDLGDIDLLILHSAGAMPVPRGGDTIQLQGIAVRVRSVTTAYENGDDQPCVSTHVRVEAISDTTA